MRYKFVDINVRYLNDKFESIFWKFYFLPLDIYYLIYILHRVSQLFFLYELFFLRYDVIERL